MPRELGKVMLVGAGPGAADLLTLRALRVIQGADALLYDALVEAEVLDLAPRRCLRIRTGKRANGLSMGQEEINALMLKLARQGRNVVRLKGGDPSIFGRSGEEVDFLQARGIEVEIVPGVTAASAAAAQFGFALTHRGAARRVMFATARVRDGAIVEDGWPLCADPSTTLALYMARDSAELVCRRLITEGRSPHTPALAVENAGRPNARLLKATLANLGATVAQAAPMGPVVLIVGAVAAQAGRLDGDAGVASLAGCG